MLYKSEGLSPVRIKAEGIEYHRVGDQVNGYYLYYTKSPGANPGVPVENLSFDSIPIIEGAATVIGVTGADKDGNAQFIENFTGCNGFIHMEASLENAAISDMRVFSGLGSQLLTDMMRSGYNYFVTESLNARAGGDPVYLAYKMCSSEIADLEENDFDEAGDEFDDEWDGDDDDWDFDDEGWFDFDFDMDFDDGAADNLVRDIICTVGKEAKESIKLDGVTYSLVSPVSLNQGAAGKSICLYMTRDQIEATFEKEPATGAFSGLKNLLSGKSTYTDYLSPITDICLCSGDAVPEATVVEAEPAGFTSSYSVTTEKQNPAPKPAR